MSLAVIDTKIPFVFLFFFALPCGSFAGEMKSARCKQTLRVLNRPKTGRVALLLRNPNV